MAFWATYVLIFSMSFSQVPGFTTFHLARKFRCPFNNLLSILAVRVLELSPPGLPRFNVGY